MYFPINEKAGAGLVYLQFKVQRCFKNKSEKYTIRNRYLNWEYNQQFLFIVAILTLFIFCF